jgi:hypothetical protein
LGVRARVPWLAVAALSAAVLASAGCGGSSRRGATIGVTTVARYDQYGPDTISVPTTNPSSRPCRTDAGAYALTSTYFLAHNGPEAAYPADLYYIVMREELADFEARRCSPALLGSALAGRLTASRRRALVADLPRAMADVVREALAAARS